MAAETADLFDDKNHCCLEDRLCAFFEKRMSRVEQEMRAEIEKQKAEIEKQRLENQKQREEIESIRIENESLRSVVNRVESDNDNLLSLVTRIDSDNARLLNDLSEVHDDLRILHPLPYARLHLEKCIEHQIACNDAVNAFIEAHTITVIDASPSLTLQLQELKKNLKKAWDARFAAAFLCEPPPTLSKVIWIVAKNGYTEEVIRCMNLNRATRNCKFLQPLMREVKDGEYGMTQLNYFAWKGLTKSVNRMLSMKGIDVESRDR
jgi:hypothetical protein